MGPADCGVDVDVPGDQTLGVGPSLQGGEDPLPGAVPLPAAEQVIHPPPGPVPLWDIPPWRPSPGPPPYAVDQLPPGPCRRPARLLALRQQRFQHRPLRIRQISTCHEPRSFHAQDPLPIHALAPVRLKQVHPDGSWARASAAKSRALPTVHQGGPRRLWDLLTDVLDRLIIGGELPVTGLASRSPPTDRPRSHAAGGQPPCRHLAGHQPEVFLSSIRHSVPRRPRFPESRSSSCRALETGCIAIAGTGDAVLVGAQVGGPMGYTAVHADWGRLDASADDLGCGRSWADVHRVKGLELACPECRGRVFARISPTVPGTSTTRCGPATARWRTSRPSITC